MKGVILEQRDRRQQRMDGGLFHFLLLFMTQPDRQSTKCEGWWEAAVDTTGTNAHMFPESLTKPDRNQLQKHKTVWQEM